MNLKARYGKSYRIAREEGAEPNDPAGWIIPCKRGHIYAHGRELLAVATDRQGPIVKQLLALTVKQAAEARVASHFVPGARSATMG